MTEVFILAGARTPFATWAPGKTADGKPGGAFKKLDPFDLGAAALRGALDRAGARPDELDRVVFANMYHVGPHACYGGRYASLRAGVPDRIPSLTVSMACASGLFALAAAAASVREGARLVGMAGSDNISMVRRDVFVPSFTDISCGKEIGRTVDDLAREYGVSRRAQDEWALRSHRLARRAQLEGRSADEIVEAAGLREDDAVLREPGPGAFAQAETAFGEQGTVTAANTHALVDGASALILASPEGARRGGRPPLGRWVAVGYAATPPDRMGYASVPAIRGALGAAGFSVRDIDLFEINETFAAQVLIDLKELGLSEERVNVNGGALALGHPFAATGGRQVLSLLLELRRRGLKRGAASICAGGGQGAAAIVETV